jgi:hypothetical protein
MASDRMASPIRPDAGSPCGESKRVAIPDELAGNQMTAVSRQPEGLMAKWILRGWDFLSIYTVL